MEEINSVDCADDTDVHPPPDRAVEQRSLDSKERSADVADVADIRKELRIDPSAPISATSAESVDRSLEPKLDARRS